MILSEDRNFKLLGVDDESHKMITNSRDQKELLSKQEASLNKDNKPLTSSRSWSALKDPRIVRVSRLFGGKDRHSKVSTVRGLRDRRVRLSVPTAIQLYDLQDRLGLSQPSKVIDWLLQAAQHDIDKLPPLQMIPPVSNFIHFPHSIANLSSTSKSSDIQEFEDHASMSKSALYRRSNKHRQEEQGEKEEEEEEAEEQCTTDKMGIDEDNIEEKNQGVSIHHSLSSLLHNAIPYTSFYHYDPTSQDEVFGNNSTDYQPAATSFLSSPYTMPTLLPSYTMSQNVSQFQMGNSSSDVLQSLNSLRSGTSQSGNSTVRYFH
ncbi:hypothetical protein J5N97_008425 [Dioscorea zingiberensis]|uniref:TCP domain-containing protein n=1 Tax=Dioscorea zingiberensis TaxID=325984 RepID=A0A9D5CXM4_9LILI|nr:hypothetical protein J5N97_008425 [Dioscorea zingiberensis]